MQKARQYFSIAELCYISLTIIVSCIDYLIASSTATAQATVAPTIGLFPIPKKPIIST